MSTTFSPIILPKRALEVLGVPGRYLGATMRPDEAPGCFCQQKWISERRDFARYHRSGWLQVEVRFDDDCQNKRNSFAITATASHPGTRDFDAGGCLHEEIAQAFPGLASLIRWHCCFTDSPMHYLANTLYHAGDRDHNGLKAGETRQLRNGKSNLPAWQLVAIDEEGNEVPTYKLPRCIDAAEAPAVAHHLEWRPWNIVGTGKDRDLEGARYCAVWPEATNEELTDPGLRERLEARLPGLLAEFRSVIESIGFLWKREEP